MAKPVFALRRLPYPSRGAFPRIGREDPALEAPHREATGIRRSGQLHTLGVPATVPGTGR